jgi:hypothetical protein
VIVRTASVEIVGRSGWSRDLRSYVFPGDGATVRRARFWSLRLPIGKRDWLMIEVNDGMRFAVLPEGDLDEAEKSCR